MPRPFTARQAAQNRAFLAALARTGNARLAATLCGLHRSTLEKRRRKHPDFAQRWQAALNSAQAALAAPRAAPPPASARLRTQGGEPTVTRLKSGRLQLRLAAPGRITRAAEQAFLAALGDTANIRLAAAEAGFAHTSFLARARAHPDFGARLDAVLAQAQERLAWEEVNRASHLDPASWSFDADLPIPPMSVEQALLQLTFHREHGRFQAKRRRRRAPPRPLAHYAPRILAAFELVELARRHEARCRNSGESPALSIPNQPFGSKAMSKRELIDTGTDKRYVRRDEEGKFKESDDVGRSLAADQRQHAETKKPRGEGDKGD